MVETVKHGETGFLVGKNDAQGLAEALLRLLENDALREQMGRAARRRAMEHFTWETVAESLYNRYQRLCGVSREAESAVDETGIAMDETGVAVNTLLQ